MSEPIAEAEFKQENITRLGPRQVPIPDGWEAVSFEEAIELNPSYHKPNEGVFDFLPMDAVDEEMQSIEYWTQRRKDDCTTTWFKNGDTVYAKITPCTENGKIAFVDNLNTEIGSGSTEFLVFHPRKGVTEERFVYYLVNLPEFRSVTISLMEGSTGRQRVPTDVFSGGIEVPLPPLPEQRRIAEILSTVDAQIQQTEDVIRTTRELKRGFLQDFYYSPEHGSTTTEEPSQVPENWEAKRLDEVCEIGGGSTPKKSNEEFWGGDMPWCSPKEFDEDGIIQDTKDHVTESGIDEASLTVYPEGTILVTVRSNAIKRRLPIAKIEAPATVNQDLKALVPDEEQINPEYLFQILHFNSERIRLTCRKSGTTIDSIDTTALPKYQIMVPSLEAQRQFADTLSTMDQKIQQEQDKKQTLQQLKRGLMQDLLTGKRRVETDE